MSSFQLDLPTMFSFETEFQVLLTIHDNEPTIFPVKGIFVPENMTSLR